MSWFWSIVIHAALLLLAVLAMGEWTTPVGVGDRPDEPDLQCRLVPKGPFIGFERTPDWYGRWPRKCPHRSLRRERPEIEEFVRQDDRCTLCGQSWWDVRDAIWD